MKVLPILVWVILWPFFVVSQDKASGQIKGRVLDEDLRFILSGATIALVHAKDSTPTTYSAMTGEKGIFTISSINPGSYRAYVTFLGYQSRLLPSEILVSSANIDLGDVLLKRKTIQLKEFEISETRSPFVMRKDTIVFRADYYKTKETSPIEALLKKLPGLEITPDGIIKYNGKVIEAILIDGRPFFGNDIKKATKNLLSGIIETVQVIDRESNNPDGSLSKSDNQEKVINLTLKKSVYGRLNGLIGADGGDRAKYKFNASLNKFGHQSQLSLISGGDNVSNFEPDGSIPENLFRFWRAGLNYNTDINSKMSIGGSYSYDDIGQDLQSKTSRQNIFGDSVSVYRQSLEAIAKTEVHSVNLNFTYNMDSLTTIAFNGNFSINSLQSLNNSSYSTSSQSKLINDGTLLLSSDGKKLFTNDNITLNRKFNKVGRKLKLSLNYLWMKDDNKDQSDNTTRYSFPHDSIQTDNLKQYSLSKDQRSEINFNFEFSEPLTKDLSLGLFYNFSTSDNPFSKYTYDYNPASGKTDVLNDTLSGHLHNSKDMQSTGMILKVQKQRFNIEIGANLISILQKTNSSLNQEKYRLNVLKFFPLTNIDYQLNSKSKIHFDYSKKLSTPQRQQLFMIPNTYNPLFIAEGNSNLKATTSDFFNLSYQFVDPYTARSLTILGSLAFIQNQIVTTINYDTLGRMVSVPVNLNGFSNGSFFFLNGFQLKSINSILSTSTTVSWNKEVNLVNQRATTANRAAITQGITMNYHHKEIIELSASLNATYNLVRYPSDRTLNTNYADYLFNLNSAFKLPGAISFTPNANYRLFTGRSEGFNNSRLILNFTLSKAFLKSQALMVRVQGFDMLDQNNSIFRNVGPGYIEDVESNALRRFFMLGAVYYIK